MEKNNEDVQKLEEEKEETTECKSVLSEESKTKEIQQIERTISEVNTSTSGLKKFSSSDIQKPDTKAHRARKIGKSDFSIVNTEDNGKRVKFSKELLKKLGITNIDEGTIDIGFISDGTIISSNLSGIGETFPLSKGGHIYSKDLVDEVTQRFNLDFSGVTTRSFCDPEYQQLEDGVLVAILKM